MTQLLTRQQKDAVLHELNQAANHEVWGKSKFLTAIGKRIATIRDDFKKLMTPANSPVIEKYNEDKDTVKASRTIVYIGLYCSKGNVINNWLSVLTSLPMQLASRPIHLEESQAIDLVNSKANKENEAYIAVEIPSSSIVQLVQNKILMDKLGHQLATLKGRPFDKHFTGTFVHKNIKYHYADYKLTAES